MLLFRLGEDLEVDSSISRPRTILSGKQTRNNGVVDSTAAENFATTVLIVRMDYVRMKLMMIMMMTVVEVVGQREGRTTPVTEGRRKPRIDSGNRIFFSFE
jgi:hypothetical protein